jgi:hypothetical protein
MNELMKVVNPNCVGHCVCWSTYLCTMKQGWTLQEFESEQFRDSLQLTILLLATLFGLFSLRIWQKLVMKGRTCIWLPMIGGYLSRILR